MAIRVFEVPSLAGDDCVKEITAALRYRPGVVHVTVNVADKQVSVDFDSAFINEAQIITIIRATGYEAQ